MAIRETTYHHIFISKEQNLIFSIFSLWSGIILPDKAAATPSLSITEDNLQTHHWHDLSHTASGRMVTCQEQSPEGGASTAGQGVGRSPPETDQNVFM